MGVALVTDFPFDLPMILAAAEQGDLDVPETRRHRPEPLVERDQIFDPMFDDDEEEPDA